MAEPRTQFKIRDYDSPKAGRLLLVTMDNGADHRKPTIFDQDALASLNAAMDEIEARDDVKGLLLTGKPHVFAAGADLKQFSNTEEEWARGASRLGHEAFGRLRALGYPTLAAINGVCLGGGLEIALHCRYRTVSSAVTALGFPEVFLSIFPAWGGTQLVPPLIGAERALEVIVSNPLRNNRLMRADQAEKIGLADRLIPGVDFLDASVALLERLVTGEETIDRPEHGAQGLDDALEMARDLADAKVHGATRAPYAAIELIEFAARGGDLAEGLRREEDLFAELLPSRQAQAAVYSFGLTQQRVKRQPGKPDAPPRDVRKVGIVGAGLMGAQLGALFLSRLEVPLVMKDIDQAVLDTARAHIEGEIDKQAQRGRMPASKADFLKGAVTYTLDYQPLAGADWVIEAVVERLDVKKQILAEVEPVVAPEAVLATNTSSLSVAAMAADLAHPGRLVGFHFFNPVAVLPLVELVRAERTDDATAATAFEVAKRLRKSAVACADAPAFVVNRVLTRFMQSCAEAVSHGNDFRQVDEAVKSLGLPMGTFELLGLIGLRVGAHVVQTLHEAFPDRFPADPNFQMLADSGLPGIYDWGRGGEPHPEIAERWQRIPDAHPLTDEEIRQRALEAVADEIKHMLDEGVVADARDIDTCMLLGAGWPFFMGGICMYLDQTGVSEKLFGERLVGATDRAFAS
ncbi:MAG TPA: 3-hydroxyacyl-CoA dehydrogenase NAD-binding domain-containing protein [Egibacteraceae bacterium]|nr:3-hydroxyacyl-CoA dehydrogenase NAD-binding domain-containing protein [Egibacteraceae bacterium]